MRNYDSLSEATLAPRASAVRVSETINRTGSSPQSGSERHDYSAMPFINADQSSKYGTSNCSNASAFEALPEVNP